MATIITQRAVITQDMPSRLLTLQLPPGVTLDKWVEAETARLRQAYPKPKAAAVELGAEAAEMLRIAKNNRDEWEQKYQLYKLILREDLGWAKKGLANDIPFIERRQFPVRGYEVEAYDQDALYPL